jgi:hypothetical protein
MGYHYDLSCVVKSAADGKPLPGVQAVLDYSGREDDLTFGNPVSQPTNADGRITHRFFVTSDAFHAGRPRWYLKLTKDGFVPEVIDIKPAGEPEKVGSTTPMFVVAYMRPNE